MATVAELIKQAESFVDEANLDHVELREPAFRETLRHLFGDSPIDGERVPFHRSLVPTTVAADASGQPPSVEDIASALEIESELISSVLSVGADAISVEAPTGRLPRAKADAAREVALVCAAVNRAVGREAHTAEVREILREYGKFDSPNFMASIKKTPGDLLTVKGRPGTRDHELIIRRGGTEEAARIITRWAGA